MQFTSIILAVAAFTGMVAAFDRSGAPSPEPQPQPQTDAASRRPSSGRFYGRGLGHKSNEILARDLQHLQARQVDIYNELNARHAEPEQDLFDYDF